MQAVRNLARATRLIVSDTPSVSRATGRRARGVSTLEYAIIMPMFVMLIYGSMQLGLAFYHAMVLESAAAEGARAGAVCAGSDPVCHAAALNAANRVLGFTVLDRSNYTVTHRLRGSGLQTRDVVRIEGDFVAPVPFYGDLTVPLDVQASRLRERTLAELEP